MGNQYRIEIEGEEMYIDLLFFNRESNCLVAVELKAGKFKPAYLGQLNTYLTILDDKVKKLHEKGNNLNKGNDDLSKLVAQIEHINELAYIQYKPIAYDLCGRIASSDEVEHILDRMLDFCGCDEILKLFKQICKHYYEIYPEMIAYEINSYREFWDNE